MKANFEALHEVYYAYPMLKPFIAYVMRHSGCTYAEIGVTLGMTRQAAKALVKSMEDTLK